MKEAYHALQRLCELYDSNVSMIQSFSAEMIIIIGNFSLFNSQYFNFNLTRRFDFLPKSSSGVN